MFDLSDCKEKYSSQLSLLILQIIRNNAWEKSENYSNVVTGFDAYLNYACLHTFYNWFSETLEEDLSIHPLVIAPDKNSLLSIWEFVSGSAIGLGSRRIVLIPSKATDSEELCVPQEWIDIPSWAGDYYLAIQILNSESDDCSMLVVGFATHKQLKNFGKYDNRDRTYRLPFEKLISNLETMYVTLGLEMRAEIPEIPELSNSNAHKLLDLLSDKSIHSPRLKVNDMSFEEWAGLLTDNDLREKLYQKRIEPVSNKLVELRQWFKNSVSEAQNVVDAIWQKPEAIFIASEAIAVRGGKLDCNSNSSSENIELVLLVLRLLKSNEEKIRRQAAGILGEIGIGNADAIKALSELLQVSEEEETRWQAAFSLGKIDPGNPQAALEKARLIDLGMQLQGNLIALVVAIMPKGNDTIGIDIKVKPQRSGQKLPAYLKFCVLNDFNEIVPGLYQETRVNEDGYSKDKRLQLRFSVQFGTHFRVKISLSDISIIEDFVV